MTKPCITCRYSKLRNGVFQCHVQPHSPTPCHDARQWFCRGILHTTDRRGNFPWLALAGALIGVAFLLAGCAASVRVDGAFVPPIPHQFAQPPIPPMPMLKGRQ